MLNRHTIVLFLGLAALVLLGESAAVVTSALGLAFLSLVVGLLLDPGHPGPRANAGHLLQAAGVVLVAYNAVLAARAGALHLALGEAGIALAVAGLLVEMQGGYGALKPGAALQALGDAIYLAGFAVAFLLRSQQPSTLGWIFIAIAGLLGVYAAAANLVLQVARLRNRQAGWRYRVLEVNQEGLRLKTLDGEVKVGWQHVEAVRRLDARHLLLVLPSPLPPELARAGLPLEELRENPEPTPEEQPPERYALVLHEQELGQMLPAAEQRILSHLPSRA